MSDSLAAFRVQAPGKLVLVGEYAVVDGGPAIVIAIDRGVTCDVTPGGEGVRIETPGGDDRFVLPALRDAPAGLYTFSDHNPVVLGGAKPGFGGSAAACVAACIAAGRPPTDAFAIHRAVQGSGSGVDVGASIAGHTIRFQGDAWHPQPTVLPVVVWSGASAHTGPRVARYRAWTGRERFVSRSTDIVDAFTDDPVAALAEAGRLLESMARAAGLDYLTPALERIRDLASDVGGSAKPSGAGGGDCAVALFPDPDRQARFEAACDNAGLNRICAVPAPGARRLDESPHLPS